MQEEEEEAFDICFVTFFSLIESVFFSLPKWLRRRRRKKQPCPIGCVYRKHFGIPVFVLKCHVWEVLYIISFLWYINIGVYIMNRLTKKKPSLRKGKNVDDRAVTIQNKPPQQIPKN